jgi:hypothetical protein
MSRTRVGSTPVLQIKSKAPIYISTVLQVFSKKLFCCLRSYIFICSWSKNKIFIHLPPPRSLLGLGGDSNNSMVEGSLFSGPPLGSPHNQKRDPNVSNVIGRPSPRGMNSSNRAMSEPVNASYDQSSSLLGGFAPSSFGLGRGGDISDVDSMFSMNHIGPSSFNLFGGYDMNQQDMGGGGGGFVSSSPIMEEERPMLFMRSGSRFGGGEGQVDSGKLKETEEKLSAAYREIEEWKAKYIAVLSENESLKRQLRAQQVAPQPQPPQQPRANASLSPVSQGWVCKVCE